MQAVKRQIWPLALVLVFYFVPLEVVKPPPFYIRDEGAWILVLVFLIVSLGFGTAALVFFVLSTATMVRRIGRPANVRSLRRTVTYAAWGAALALPVVAIVLGLTNPLYSLVYALLVGFYLVYAMPASRRLIAFRSAVNVRCTPEAAFALISDAHNWPRYLTELQVFEPLDTPLRVGSVVNERATFGRRVIDAQDVITSVEPNRKLAMRGGNAPESADMYEFRPIDDGTEISYTAKHRITVSESVIGGVFSRGADTELLLSRREKAMQRIKQILEAPAAATV